MSIRRLVSRISALCLICGLCLIAHGQNRNEAPGKAFGRIPSLFQAHAAALGKRVEVKGRERTVLVGEYLDAQGSAAQVRVVLQLPRMVRLEGFKGRGSVLAFDGDRAKNAATRADKALLETFVSDTAEGMLASIQELAAARLLGNGFGPDPRTNPNYSGPRYDIVDVFMPDVIRKGPVWQSKQYYFDSKTGLLHSTHYYDRTVSPPVKVETRFSMWGTMDGSAYPASIERYEGGKRVFSFISSDIASGPAVDDSDYR
jgi:hypothetical protein